MSKEFEETVLKKLDALDERTNNTDKVIQEEVLKKLDALDVRINNTDKVIQEVVLKKLDTLDGRTNNTDKVIQKVVLKQLEKLDEKINYTNEVVREIKQDFAKFDYEINLKIDTLFDANTVNKEKHDSFEEKIISLDVKSFNHDIRISNLEDKVLTA